MYKRQILLVGLFSYILGGIFVFRMSRKWLAEKIRKVDKFKRYYSVLNEWLMLKNCNHNLEEYFKNNAYGEIAVYGIGELGRRLCEELKDTDIEIEYIVDGKVSGNYLGVEIMDMDSQLKAVDVVVVTAVFDLERIEKQLKEKVSFPVVSLEEVIYEIEL